MGASYLIQFMDPSDEALYYQRIAKIESNNNPKAKAKTSSASGLFQFIKSTWTRLGYDWKDVFNVDLQYEAMGRLTQENAQYLASHGCYVNFATLYGAHFLGAAGLLRVMRASPSDPISKVTSAAQRKANPTILKGTVGDFCEWLASKTGETVYKDHKNPKPGDTSPGHKEKPAVSNGVTSWVGIAVVIALGATFAAYKIFFGG